MKGRHRFVARCAKQHSGGAGETWSSCSARSSQTVLSLERFGHLRDGRLGADLAEDVGDLALLVDDERRADDPHEAPPVQRLLAPCAPGRGHLVTLVGEERETEPVLLVELLLP